VLTGDADISTREATEPLVVDANGAGTAPDDAGASDADAASNDEVQD
jgi:hypothetical protein